jgi:2'-5' RNA ligase
LKITKLSEKLPQQHSINFNGLNIVVEWPKGSIREGTDKDGKKWRREMHADYGYVQDIPTSQDHEDLDVYIGDNPDAVNAYIVEQLDDDGEVDEYKVMLGFDSLAEAEEMYLTHYPDDWEETHLGEVAEVPFDYIFDRVEEHQESTEKAKYGLVMLTPPQETVNDVLTISEQLAEEDLAGHGREDEVHVTVCYGINTDDYEAIKDIIAATVAFEVTIGKTGTFPPSKFSEGAAPVFLAVSSPELTQLNKDLQASGCFKPSDFPDFHPHMTLGYVKEEAASKYDGVDALEGRTFKVTSLIISDRNKQQTEVPLGEPKAAAPRAISSAWKNFVSARRVPLKNWSKNLT